MRKKWLFLVCVFFLLLLLDAISKYYVFSHIPIMSWLYPLYPYGGIGVFQWMGISFSINHVENLGAAWGSFARYPNLLFYVRSLIVLCLFLYVIFGSVEMKKKLPFFLIITGAIGNIFDFLLYGHVIDMFYFKFWQYSYPVFNLADSLIVLGVAWLSLSLLFSKKEKHKKI